MVEARAEELHGGTGSRASDELSRFLTGIQGALLDGSDVTATMNRLSDGLWALREQDLERWRTEHVPIALAHPLCALVHEDPFTRRSFEKPRGYPGDAALLDLIYYDQGLGDLRDTTALGRAIYRRNRDAPAPRAVRERRDHLAALIDGTALRVGGEAKVLAIAAGHLREGLRSSALISGRVARMVAFDQDPLSLAEVSRAFGSAVRPVAGTVRQLLHGTWPGPRGRFDLVYAAGLLDYLDDGTVVRLVERLAPMLGDGGELVLANFVPSIRDAGYMETYMGWSLIYRTPDDLLALTDSAAATWGSKRAYLLTQPDIGYVALRR